MWERERLPEYPLLSSQPTVLVLGYDLLRFLVGVACDFGFLRVLHVVKSYEKVLQKFRFSFWKHYFWF